jgi:heat shock protein 4
VAPRSGDVVSGTGTEKTLATIRVKAKLDGSLILNLESAQQIEVVQIPVKAEQIPKEKTKENGKNIEASETNEATANNASESSESVNEIASAQSVSSRPMTKEVTRKYDLVIVGQTASHTRDVIEKWRALELEMEATDRLVIDTADRKNALEAYIYETRSKLEMAWSEYIIDSERQTFLSELTKMEDWLYSDGEDTTKSVYVEKLNQLKKLGDPVAFRYREWEDRPRAEKVLREYANSVLLGLSAEDGRYAHIASADIGKVNAEARRILDWLNDSVGKMNSMERYEDVIVTTEKIYQEKSNLSLFVDPLLSKPKPSPKKAEKPATPTPPSAAAEATPADGMEVETNEAQKDMEVD